MSEERDEATYERVLAEELAKGVDRRVAEGRAKSSAVRAWRKANGIVAAPVVAGAGATSAAPAAAESAAAPAAAAGAPAAVGVAVAMSPGVPRQAPPPTGNRPSSAKPGKDDKHRLLALVQPEGIQAVERDQGDRANTFPHLFLEEFVAMFVMTLWLTIYSTFLNAPLRDLANPNLTPNPSKAPWYFMGLQELLRYFHPMVAGITIPTFILVGLGAVPFVDRNPSNRPGDRKIAITLFTILFMFGATLTIIGSFFRGPGYNWVWPWSQGVFFDL